MSESGLLYFAILKKEIGTVLKSAISSVPSEISNWKGQDIVYFQEDLEKKVQGRISEKWFYTHIKLNSQKLPRIDMLNLLSQYAGYLDWADFMLKKSNEIPTIPIVKRNRKRLSFMLLIGIIILLTLYFSFRPGNYTFCFIDADRRVPISDQNIEIVVLNDKESPFYTKCTNSCFTIKTNKDKIRFIVKTPYYKTDTITRMLSNRSQEEKIILHTNDYALMIHFFSKSKVSDWQKRRVQLNNMFTDNVQIYQVNNEDNLGMELFNKNEFINKLTMPVKSLQNIEVIETIYTGNRISMLRFKQIKNL